VVKYYGYVLKQQQKAKPDDSSEIALLQKEKTVLGKDFARLVELLVSYASTPLFENSAIIAIGEIADFIRKSSNDAESVQKHPELKLALKEIVFNHAAGEEFVANRLITSVCSFHDARTTATTSASTEGATPADTTGNIVYNPLYIHIDDVIIVRCLGYLGCLLMDFSDNTASHSSQDQHQEKLSNILSFLLQKVDATQKWVEIKENPGAK